MTGLGRRLARAVAAALVAAALALGAAALSVSAQPTTAADTARALIREGRLADALAVYTQGLEAAPGDLELRQARARVEGWLGRYAEALADYDQVLSVTPRDVEARLGRARVLGWMSRRAEAEATVREAIADRPDSAEAHAALGDILVLQRRPAEAAAAYDQARALAPTDPIPLVGLARVRGAQGDRAGARAAYAEALTAYDHLLAQAPDDTDLRAGRARVLARLGREPEALAEIDRVVRATPRDVDARVVRGRVLLALGRAPEAEAEFRRGAELDPRSVEARVGLGDALTRQQRLAEAARAYEAARTQDPAAAEPVLGLARLRLWGEDLRGAQTGYEEALALDPGNEDAVDALGRIARTPRRRVFRLDLNYRYESLSGRTDWQQETAVLVARPRPGTVLVVGVDQYHRNDQDDTQVTAGGAQALPGGWTLAGSFTYGIDVQVVARQIYEVEATRPLWPWLIPSLRYRHSTFVGDVQADVVAPGLELVWGPYVSFFGRYYFTHSSESGDGSAGSGRFTLFPEGPVSIWAGAGYGRETYLARSVEQVIRAVDVLTVFAGARWWILDWLGMRATYDYEDRRGSYVKHGVGVGVFVEF